MLALCIKNYRDKVSKILLIIESFHFSEKDEDLQVI